MGIEICSSAKEFRIYNGQKHYEFFGDAVWVELNEKYAVKRITIGKQEYDAVKKSQSWRPLLRQTAFFKNKVITYVTQKSVTQKRGFPRSYILGIVYKDK